MLRISIENVGDHLKALLERVAQGEEIILILINSRPCDYPDSEN